MFDSFLRLPPCSGCATIFVGSVEFDKEATDYITDTKTTGAELLVNVFVGVNFNWLKFVIDPQGDYPILKDEDGCAYLELEIGSAIDLDVFKSKTSRVFTNPDEFGVWYIKL
jgi:hypothetical protein